MANLCEKSPLCDPYTYRCDSDETILKPEGQKSGHSADVEPILQLLISFLVMFGVYLIWFLNINAGMDNLIAMTVNAQFAWVSKVCKARLQDPVLAVMYLSLMAQAGQVPLVNLDAASVAKVDSLFHHLLAVVPSDFVGCKLFELPSSFLWLYFGGFNDSLCGTYNAGNRAGVAAVKHCTCVLCYPCS